MHVSSKCSTWHSVASAWLLWHAVLLVGQALLDATCQEHAINATHDGPANSALDAVGPA